MGVWDAVGDGSLPMRIVEANRARKCGGDDSYTGGDEYWTRSLGEQRGREGLSASGKLEGRYATAKSSRMTGFKEG